MNSSDPQTSIAKDSDIHNELSAIRTELTILQRELNRISAGESHVIVAVKWLMGMLVTITVLVIGGNWVVNKSNYDRDRQFLEEQSALISKQLSLEQQAANDRNLNTFQAGIQAWTSMMANNLTNSIIQFESAINVQLANSSNRISQLDSESSGAALMVQANAAWLAKNLSGSIPSFLRAANQFFNANDDKNLGMCVKALIDDLPQVNKDDFTQLESQNQNLVFELDSLISNLSIFSDNEYYDSTRFLKSERQRLTGEPYSSQKIPNP